MRVFEQDGWRLRGRVDPDSGDEILLIAEKGDFLIEVIRDRAGAYRGRFLRGLSLQEAIASEDPRDVEEWIDLVAGLAELGL